MIRQVFAYDISEDDRRARVAALLSANGIRLQRSVFHVEVDDRAALEALVREVVKLLDVATDTLHVLPQCGQCWGAHVEFGRVPRALEAPYWIV